MLLSFDGKTPKELMHIFDVERLTIYHWFDAWERHHFAGLYDRARCGRPPKLTEAEQEQAHQYMAQNPQNMKKVVNLIEQETAKCVSTKTRKRLLKKPLCLETHSTRTRESPSP
jgi:transposase